MRTRVRRLTAAAAATLLGFGLGVGDAVSAPRARVAPPPPAASPAAVTAAFFAALSVKDRSTALSLVGPGDVAERASAQFWMDHTWSLRDLTVDPRSSDPGGDDVYAGRYRTLAEVTLQFTPHWLPWVDPPGLGLEPGRLTWFVTLGRHAPGSAGLSSRRAADPDQAARLGMPQRREGRRDISAISGVGAGRRSRWCGPRCR